MPALTVAAWYDIFQDGSLRNYMGMRDYAGNADARDRQRLLVTIDGHPSIGEKIGAVDFGAAAAECDPEVSSSNFPRFDRNLNTGKSGRTVTRS